MVRQRGMSLESLMVGDECAGRHGEGGECNGLRISGEEASRESDLGIG